jgi:type IV pilus assembly protein PilX
MKASSRIFRNSSGQRGVILVSALLLLVVMTMLALLMFRTNGVQQLIAGNLRETQRAMQSAEDAEEYAELWLSTVGALTERVPCTTAGVVAYGPSSSPSVCTATVASIDDAANVITVPWTIGGSEVGFTFFPGSTASSSGDLTLSTTTPSQNSYYEPPRFYITQLTQTSNQALYQIDAWSYGATTNTTAVVESTYIVTALNADNTSP